MSLRSYFASVSLTLALATAANAQGIQNWLNNESNKIQQDVGTGQISPGQATQLQNRDAQIQSQEQQYLNQNGGVLTPQEQRQINSETRHLNQHINNDVYQNAPGGVAPNGYYRPPIAPGTPQGWNPNYPPPQGQVPNPYYHHHHHHDQNPYYNQYQNQYPNQNPNQYPNQYQYPYHP